MGSFQGCHGSLPKAHSSSLVRRRSRCIARLSGCRFVVLCSARPLRRHDQEQVLGRHMIAMGTAPLSMLSFAMLSFVDGRPAAPRTSGASVRPLWGAQALFVPSRFMPGCRHIDPDAMPCQGLEESLSSRAIGGRLPYMAWWMPRVPTHPLRSGECAWWICFCLVGRQHTLKHKSMANTTFRAQVGAQSVVSFWPISRESPGEALSRMCLQVAP